MIKLLTFINKQKELISSNRRSFALLLVFMFAFIVEVPIGVAQNHSAAKHHSSNKQTITGIIIDSQTGEPIIGVSIGILKSQGSNQIEFGAITGIDGDFKLSISNKTNTFIRVSQLGYESRDMEIPYNTSEPIRIFLTQDVTLIDDVVVIGYAKIAKEKVTGSIATIKNKVLVNSPTDNPFAALQGRLPGVHITQSSGEPGADVNILIRGKATFTSSTEPLYLIDGMPFSNSDVLKNLSPLSTLNNADIERIDILKDADATAIYGSRGANGVVLITTKKGTAGAMKISASADFGVSMARETIEFLNTQEYLAMRNDAFIADGIKQTNTNAYDLLLWDPNAYTNWQKTMLGNPANSTNVQVSASGGSERTQVLFSAGLYDTESVILEQSTDQYTRINGRLNVVHKSKDDRFIMNTSMSYSSLRTKDNGLSPTSYIRAAPNMPLYDDSGDPYWVPNDRNFAAPLSAEHKSYESDVSTFTGVMNLSYELIDNLILKADLGYTRTNGNRTGLEGNKSINPYNNRVDYYNRATINKSYRDQYNVEPQLTYTNKHGKGTLTTLVGMTIQSIYDHSLSNTLYDFPLESMMENAGSAERISSVTTTSSQYRFASVFGRIGYEWDERYIINGVFRRDGSSRFHSDNQFGNFGSVGAAWIFSETELFKKYLGAVSYGKLRTSYGITGNDGVGNYKYFSTYAFHRQQYNGDLGFYPNRIANDEFGWEDTRKFEIGLELGLFNRNLFIEASYYNNNSGNTLVSYPLPSQSGFSSYQANLDALIRNTGFELSLISTNIRREDFLWTTNFNITIPENKLIEFPGLEDTSYYTKYAIGKPLTTFRVYEYEGIDPETGIPLVVDQNDDGVIDSTNDKVFKGNSSPDFYGGLGSTLSYKGLELDFFFQFSYQPEAYSYLRQYSHPTGMYYNVPKELAQDYWTPTNTDATRPGLTTLGTSKIGKAYDLHYTESDATFSNASYIRLKNVSLSYTIPQKWSKRIKISNARIYMNAQNLLTFTNYFGWDPETGRSSTPTTQTVTLGISITI